MSSRVGMFWLAAAAAATACAAAPLGVGCGGDCVAALTAARDEDGKQAVYVVGVRGAAGGSVLGEGEGEAQVRADHDANEGPPDTPGGDAKAWTARNRAYLYLPGTYRNSSLPLGFNMAFYGVGGLPDDVRFDGCEGPRSTPLGTEKGPGALDDFWRSAENFQQASDTGMLWAASQAAPLRRIIVDNALNCFKNSGYASGGFLANARVGQLNLGAQQQYFLRRFDSPAPPTGGAWNFVVDDSPAPALAQWAATAPLHAVTRVPVDRVRKVAEKPYIVYTGDGTTRFAEGDWRVCVPAVGASGAPGGASFADCDTAISFADVVIATPATAVADINALLAGPSPPKAVLLTPGTHLWDAPLHVPKGIASAATPFVLLGLGLPLLQPQGAHSVIAVADATNVRVAGVVVEAGAKGDADGTVLVDFGSGDETAAAAAPGVLSDLFVRVGGRVANASAETMLRINAPHSIVDHAWLWRADHDVGGSVRDITRDVARHALVVAPTAESTHVHGLFAEHATEDLVVWRGSRGALFFLQEELPYDAVGTWPFAGVAVTAPEFESWGIGVYHFFDAGPVTVPIAVNAPDVPCSALANTFGVHLSGDGGFVNIVTCKCGNATGAFGGATTAQGVRYVDPAPPCPLTTIEVCVANRSIDPAAVGGSLGYACGQGGVDCAAINEGGAVYYPNDLFTHADWAFGKYYEAHRAGGRQSCDFGGAAYLAECINFGERCRAKAAATDDQLGSNLEFLCGANALADRCAAIQPGGTHYEPNTVRDHANWAMDTWYQTYRCTQGAGACDFGGTGEVVRAV